MNIQQEFQQNNPSAVYIDHKWLPDNRIGVSYLIIVRGSVLGGVRVYEVKNNNIDWTKTVARYSSWKEIQR